MNETHDTKLPFNVFTQMCYSCILFLQHFVLYAGQYSISIFTSKYYKYKYYPDALWEI